ncbi:transcriptional repressor [Fulvivirgaceae bacterium PWU20]|uniref:Transcriptional repressor n=2 Tax=Chryseosolibacter indicus TaxID=2782351 RepID=A0ABS5VT39_9BACT|nr:transcriptional repressor [Chryseosolibacter indicus]MBT1704198.1 transcriptional repressor [Chryseosolibacter indicus]
MNAVSEKLLRDFRLRSTPTRQEILDLFLNSNYALSYGDIEKEISESDRVTVYRTLKTFLDKGLIHKVLDDEGSLKYALCNDACDTSGHHHDHVHFKCMKCGQTNCINVDIPEVKLPKGYVAQEKNLLIQGICDSCAR